MTLPTNLRIASWFSNSLTPIATPLLQQGVMLYFSVQNVDSYIAMWLYQFFGAFIYAFDWQPDMIMMFDNNIGHYNEMITNMWHELSHSSHFNSIRKNFDSQTAVEYWNYVVFYEADHTLNYNRDTYGSKGDWEWERIALTEGWAKFREWYLGIRYLNYNILNPTNSSGEIYYFTDNPLWQNDEFNFEYAGMFQELYNANCKMQNLEKALSAITLDEFYEKLVLLEPLSNRTAINTIMLKYNP
ncbi:MAG: hypothetical protein LBC68_03715 [Prevotellaceae bacterium]|jgi:hypothetical protein|nr:hypothetical protein [Prevotellaceae bacterium]